MRANGAPREPQPDATETAFRLESGIFCPALLQVPGAPLACCVLAHGAGAGMRHPFMALVAAGLAKRGIATLRFDFPYMARGSRRPDPPAVAQAAVRAAVTHAATCLPGVPLVAGGKSFGGRMSSQAQAEAPLPGVRGLAFLGFPLHPAGKPATGRARHLATVRLPLIFVQGTRDPLADAALMGSVVQELGQHARVHFVAGADHSFRVPARGARNQAQAYGEILDTVAAWIAEVVKPSFASR